jgi:D-amino-acid dehydrogenase
VCLPYIILVKILGQTLVPNLYAITGHGSKGWTLAFGSAALLADIIDGKETKVSTCKPWI